MNTSLASAQERSLTELLRLAARALAPYVAEELRRADDLASEALDADYDDRTCRRLVGLLGDAVLERADSLFAALARDGVIDSVELADLLGVPPRGLSGSLTTPIKRHAKALGLPLPFEGGFGGQPYGGINSPSADMDERRTHWRDRNGIAIRMLRAIEQEAGRRGLRLAGSEERSAHAS